MALAGSYYNRGAGTVLLQVRCAQAATTVEKEWGLVDYDGQGRVVAIEVWRAPDVLPTALLDVMPELDDLLDEEEPKEATARAR